MQDFSIHDCRFSITMFRHLIRESLTLKFPPIDLNSGVIMKLRKFLCALILALFSLQSLQFTARADEGMWPFNNVPRAEIKRKYGFDVTDEWLHKVQLGSVRFNSGGSGSFVSADGLVMTNHHIASDVLQQIST